MLKFLCIFLFSGSLSLAYPTLLQTVSKTCIMDLLYMRQFVNAGELSHILSHIISHAISPMIMTSCDYTIFPL